MNSKLKIFDPENCVPERLDIRSICERFSLNPNIQKDSLSLFEKLKNREKDHEILSRICVLLTSKLSEEYLLVDDILPSESLKEEYLNMEKKAFIYFSEFVLHQGPLMVERDKNEITFFENGNLFCKIYGTGELSSRCVKEIYTLKKIRDLGCPGLVNCMKFGYDTNSSSFYYISERATSNLHTLIKSGEIINTNLLIDNLIDAVLKLHSVGIVHCDISPYNILVYPDRFVLSDYDNITISKYDDPRIGSCSYSAPEFFLRKYRITEKVDYWSMGCVIYECLTRRKYEYLEHPIFESGKKINSLLLSLLNRKPEKRSFDEYRNI